MVILLAIVIDISLLKEQSRLSLCGILDDADVDGGIFTPHQLDGHVCFELDVKLVGDLVILKGSVDCSLKSPCVLCLTTVRLPLVFEVEQVFSLGHHTEQSEDIICISTNCWQLDVTDVVVEELICNLPLKVVCSESCRGLCFKCGTNLNHNRCDCLPDVDERLRKLANYRPKT